MTSSNSSNADALDLTELRVALDSTGKTTRGGTQHPAVQPSSQDPETKSGAVQDELKKLRARIKASRASVNFRHSAMAVLKKERKEAEGGSDDESEA